MISQIPNFNQAKVLVCGDAMLDRYWQGSTSRISPEAPVPVVNIKEIEDRLGGCCNVALNLAVLGVNTKLLAARGADENGQLLARLLDASGIEAHFFKYPSLPTITKLRILSRHQQLIRLDFEESFQGVDLSQLYADFAQQLEGNKVVVLSDYGKGTLNNCQQLIQIARQQGVKTLVDPKGTDFSRYQGATLLTPNTSEFEAVVGACNSEAEFIQKAQQLIQTLNLEALLITRSEKGMTLVQANGEVLHQPTKAREVFDVTGAGDTVIAVLAASLAAGQNLKQALLLANTAAGVVVGKIGTATVTQEELRRELRLQQNSGAGVLDEATLIRLAADVRAAGEKIVMTNGCFDIIHPGHVQYLKEAKALGDRLLVAVNTDESVSRLKGPTRPINNLEHRMAVLAGLESVDWVVPFAEETPERLICKLLPDVLVKGGDYKIEEIAGHECVQANGGKVEVLSFKEACSTSAIVEKIQKSEN